MITLIIKEKGHLIEIPGMPPFRTPAKVDISKGDVRTIVGYLKVCSINDYEIIASNAEGGKERYSSKDFNVEEPEKRSIKKVIKPDKKLNDRLGRLEKMMEKVIENSENESSKKIEQNTNQLEGFQKRVLDAIKDIHIHNVSEKTVMEELDDESVEPFIPEIDVNGMKINSQGNTKTIKKEDKDIDDTADALSKLLK